VEGGGKMTLLKVYDSKIAPSFAFVNLVCKKEFGVDTIHF